MKFRAFAATPPDTLRKLDEQIEEALQVGARVHDFRVTDDDGGALPLGGKEGKPCVMRPEKTCDPVNCRARIESLFEGLKGENVLLPEGQGWVVTSKVKEPQTNGSLLDTDTFAGAVAEMNVRNACLTAVAQPLIVKSAKAVIEAETALEEAQQGLDKAKQRFSALCSPLA